MAIMLSDAQIRVAIRNIPVMKDDKIVQAHSALRDIMAEHNATAMELKLFTALEDEMRKRKIKIE